MQVATPNINRIAEAYQISRQHVFNVRRAHDLKPEDFADPAKVFAALLDGRACALRRRLGNPVIRALIEDELR